jgi:hypothetical protein
MAMSISVREELVACIARHIANNDGEQPEVVRMTRSKYLRLGAELGYCLKRIGQTRIEFFLSETERKEANRA